MVDGELETLDKVSLKCDKVWERAVAIKLGDKVMVFGRSLYAYVNLDGKIITIRRSSRSRRMKPSG